MKKSQKGQSLAEFAYVLPYLLLIIFGIVIFGAAFFRVVQVQNAAREGLRAAQAWQVTDGSQTCYDYVVDHVDASVTYPVTVTVSANCSDTNAWLRIASGAHMEVTVSNDYEPIFFGTLFKDQYQPPTTIPIYAPARGDHE